MRHHLAVLYRTFLDDVIEGRKTIECRLGQLRYAPHNRLAAGDLIWFKEVSGPVRAVALVGSVRSLSPLTPQVVDWIRREWNPQIRAPEDFWRTRRRADAATLAWLTHVCPLEPFRIAKSDRQAWVVLDGPPVPDHPLVAAREEAGPTPLGERMMPQSDSASGILASAPRSGWLRRCPECDKKQSYEKIADIWPHPGPRLRDGDGVYRCRTCGRVIQIGPEHPPGAV